MRLSFSLEEIRALVTKWCVSVFGGFSCIAVPNYSFLIIESFVRWRYILKAWLHNSTISLKNRALKRSFDNTVQTFLSGGPPDPKRPLLSSQRPGTTGCVLSTCCNLWRVWHATGPGVSSTSPDWGPSRGKSREPSVWPSTGGNAWKDLFRSANFANRVVGFGLELFSYL